MKLVFCVSSLLLTALALPAPAGPFPVPSGTPDGLTFWFSSQDGLTLLPQAGGLRVNSWKDLGPDHLVLERGSPARRPERILDPVRGGVPTLRFATSTLTSTTEPLVGDVSFVVTLRDRPVSTFSAYQGLVTGSRPVETPFSLGLRDDRAEWTVGGATVASARDLLDGEVHVLVATRDATSGELTLLVDGILAGVATSLPGDVQVDRLWVGSTALNSDFATMDLYEVMAFPQVLGVPAARQVERWIRNRIGEPLDPRPIRR